MSERRRLAEAHTPRAIAERLEKATEHSYLGDFVLGAIDGAVTTFAVVAGVAGSGMSTGVAIVLGLANLLADGFSMAIGNYLGTETEKHVTEHARKREERHIEEFPEGEREEIRQIFAAKGFSGELLEQIVETITDDHRRWVDTMLTDELGLRLNTPSPVRAGLTTFVAFALAGFVPLAPLMVLRNLSPGTVFATSALATAATFVAIGVAKGWVVHRPLVRSALETLLIGSAAAGLAYAVGALLKAVGIA